MATTTASRKAKGRNLQNHVVQTIRDNFPDINNEDDVVGTGMGQSGTDIKLSRAAKQLFPYSVECKNQESLNIWSALEQCETNAEKHPGTHPVVVFKRNRSKVYAVIEFEHFMELVK